MVRPTLGWIFPYQLMSSRQSPTDKSIGQLDLGSPSLRLPSKDFRLHHIYNENHLISLMRHTNHLEIFINYFVFCPHSKIKQMTTKIFSQLDPESNCHIFNRELPLMKTVFSRVKCMPTNSFQTLIRGHGICQSSSSTHGTSHVLTSSGQWKSHL